MPPFLQSTICRVKSFWRCGLDILFPPRCLCCNSLVTQLGALCPECWQGMAFNAPPRCAICSYPFAYDMGGSTLCGLCIHTAPPYYKAHTVLHYNEKSKTLVHGLKYGDKTHIVPYIAEWMTRAGQDSLASADLLVPVPLHKYRLIKRRYNQAALLGIAVAKRCGLPIYPDCLLRIKHTSFQAQLSPKERAHNIKGVFKLNPKYATLIQKKHIVLIDDVMTTGATATACSNILLKGGAGRVSVLTLAKTIKEL